MKEKKKENDQYIDDFLSYIQSERGLSNNTLEAYKHDVQQLYQFLQNHFLEESSWPPKRSHIEAYTQFLHTSDLQMSSQARKMVSIKVFLKFLFREGYIQENIASFFETSKQWQKVPSILHYHEIEALLEKPDLSSHTGIRDSALLEVLYGTGMRVSELCSLSLYDVSDETIRVKGKGAKERVIPIGEKALMAIDRYLHHVRSQYESKEITTLFLTDKGAPITRRFVWKRIQEYKQSLGISKKVSPHVFRHTYASHLLESGGDIRVIQDLLGHDHISSTDRYTQITTSHIQELFHMFHPRWKEE